jgi:predicted RNase H-like HicB family nuclease
VPEAITQGIGEKDAVWQAADCLDEAIAGRIASGTEIPKPRINDALEVLGKRLVVGVEEAA